MPSGASNCLARAPAATRAAVSRALARSSTPRIEPRYFIDPLRSPWPGRGQGRSSMPIDLVVLVGNDQGDGTAQGDAPPKAAEHVDVIGFEPLPAAAAIAALTAMEFGVDQLGTEFHAGRETRPPGQPAPCRAIRLRSDIVTYWQFQSCGNPCGCHDQAPPGARLVRQCWKHGWTSQPWHPSQSSLVTPPRCREFSVCRATFFACSASTGRPFSRPETQMG